jgi:hypothetical protein
MTRIGSTRLFAWFACLWACSSLSLLASAAQLPPEFREYARRLVADDFRERQLAQQWLTATPDAAALPWLMEIARGKDPEAGLRVIRVLERWMVKAPLELADLAERTLEDLSREGPAEIERRAAETLSVQRQLRQRRAVAALRSLGAKVDLGPDLDALSVAFNVEHADANPQERELMVEAQIDAVDPDRELLADDEINDRGDPAQADQPTRESLPQVPRQVFLTSRWTGGDAGTRHLRRLAGVGQLHVYVVRGCGTSLTSVQEATAEIEEVSVQERGPSLGVGNGSAFECLVGRVLRGGAAEQAGIEPGDLVVEIEDEPIESFADLVTEVGQYEPGDEVEITIVRGLQAMQKQVKLGDWTEVDTETELWKSDGARILGVPRRVPMFFPPMQPNVPVQPKFPFK